MNKIISLLYRAITKSKPGRAAYNLFQKMKAQCFERNLKKTLEESRKRSEKCVFVLATPCHGNLGDHAIVESEHEIIKDLDCHARIVEISNIEYQKYKPILKKYIKALDVLIIDGGGNLGSLWPIEDDKISEIIKEYKDNRIIVFPQTCFYGDGDADKKRLERNKEIYAAAKKLTICLRDRKSYEYCVTNFAETDCIFVPDIVLYSSKDMKKEREDKCMICFRGDIEKQITVEDEKRICNYLMTSKIKVEQFSTIYPQNLNKKTRKGKLREIWGNLSEAKLVITDRLHGMIFAAITGTPCLALDNKSKKVTGVYEWLCNLDYIFVCSSVEELILKIPEMYDKRERRYSRNLLSGGGFTPLESLLKKEDL